MLKSFLNAVSSTSDVLEISEGKCPAGESSIDFSKELPPASQFKGLTPIMKITSHNTVTYVIPAGSTTINSSALLSRWTSLTLTT